MQVTACTVCNPRLVLSADKNTKLEPFSKSQRRSPELLRVLQLHGVWRPSAFKFINTRGGGFELTVSNWETCEEQTRTAATLPERGLFLSFVVDSLLPHFISTPCWSCPALTCVRCRRGAEICDSAAECWHIILVGGTFFDSLSFFLSLFLVNFPSVCALSLHSALAAKIYTSSDLHLVSVPQFSTFLPSFTCVTYSFCIGLYLVASRSGIFKCCFLEQVWKAKLLFNLSETDLIK